MKNIIYTTLATVYLILIFVSFIVGWNMAEYVNGGKKLFVSFKNYPGYDEKYTDLCVEVKLGDKQDFECISRDEVKKWISE